MTTVTGQVGQGEKLKMAYVQRADEVCDKCGTYAGLYETNCRTNEEWFVCEACGWGYQTAIRRFGQDTLSELRDITKGSRWHEAWPLVDSILRTLVSECNEHRNDVDNTIPKIQALLAREISARTEADAELVETLASHTSLFVMENGHVVKDYIEEPPRIRKIPLAELRPMSELAELLRPRDREGEDAR